MTFSLEKRSNMRKRKNKFSGKKFDERNQVKKAAAQLDPKLAAKLNSGLKCCY